jgi:pimeloyl-ACP methyl ester carboxylesterase
MADELVTGSLRVPGADLHYRIRGKGPVLFIIQGGAGSADGSDGMARCLTDDYTVVSYDRRGLSNSTLDDPDAGISIRTHSEDAYLLLAALTSEPALVFASSIGALIALDLVTRHPERVRVLVAHETAGAQLLPEPERGEVERAQDEIDEEFRRDGRVFPAMRKLLELAGFNPADEREPEVDPPSPTAMHLANMKRFLQFDAPAAHVDALDLEALKAVTDRIVSAAGRTTPHTAPHHCAQALAELTGRELVILPGGHTGYVLRPREFAAGLKSVLTAAVSG